MTFLPGADAVDALEVVRQKGELELEGLCQRLYYTELCCTARWVLGVDLRRAVCWQQRDC